MAEAAIRRRLAAVMAADMVGFSRLMREDEDGTLRRQKRRRAEVIDPAIAAHGGRIVKVMGDGLLVEFPSVTDALTCALEVQGAMAGLEADLPEDRRLRYRVGVNLGDLMIDGDDIMGDGVNVAARLEALAEPGGICVSEAALGMAAAAVKDRFAEMGPQTLKNIDAPVRAWRWAPGEAARGPAAPPAPAGPDRPSVAVLPFDNMSGDSEQDFFADGMAEDLITELSRMPWFYVIARNSSFTYKGRAVDMKQAGRDLGAAYVVEGSVRKAGARLRVTAQLIDTTSGAHVWAERYDRELADIFDVQDEIVRAIVNAVTPEFVSAELRRTRRKDPAQLSAWECVMRGRAHIWKMARDDALEARRLFERAMQLAPGSGLGAADLALVHLYDAFYGWSGEKDPTFSRMMAVAREAEAADETDPMALTCLAAAYIFGREWDRALETADRALAASPNFAPAIGMKGSVFACMDEPDLGISTVQQAVRLSPQDGFLPFWYMAVFWAYHSIQDYETGAAVVRRGLRVAPGNPSLRRQLAVACWMLGDQEAARNALADYRKLMPDARVSDARLIPSRSPEHLERFLDALRAMGLPE